MQELCRFLIKTCIYAKKVVPLRRKGFTLQVYTKKHRYEKEII
jgi:hypothetical protein